jgi:hypothetical protein
MATNLCGLAVDGKPPATWMATNCLPGINCHQYSIPVYLAASNDPMCRVQWRYSPASGILLGYDGWAEKAGQAQWRYSPANGIFPRRAEFTTNFYCQIPNGAVAALPTFAVPASNYYGMGGVTDAHMDVVEPGRHYVDEFGLMRKDSSSPGDWICAIHSRTDLYGSGVELWKAWTRAYGGSALGGLIRVWEIKAGSIRHALAMCLWGSQIGAGPIWPAISQDGPSEYCGHVRQGTLVAIPSSVNISNIGITTSDGLVIARALQNYGAYLVDCGGDVFYAEPAAEGAVGPQLDNMRADLPRIWPYLRPVTNNSPTSIGGGGTPLQPLAPPLGVSPPSL